MAGLDYKEPPLTIPKSSLEEEGIGTIGLVLRVGAGKIALHALETSPPLPLNLWGPLHAPFCIIFDLLYTETYTQLVPTIWKLMMLILK